MADNDEYIPNKDDLFQTLKGLIPLEFQPDWLQQPLPNPSKNDILELSSLLYNGNNELGSIVNMLEISKILTEIALLDIKNTTQISKAQTLFNRFSPIIEKIKQQSQKIINHIENNKDMLDDVKNKNNIQQGINNIKTIIENSFNKINININFDFSVLEPIISVLAKHLDKWLDNINDLGISKKLDRAKKLTLEFSSVVVYGVNELIKLIYHKYDSLWSYTKELIKYTKQYLPSSHKDIKNNKNINNIENIETIEIEEVSIEQQIINNNNFGLEEEEIKKLVRFYLQQNKSIAEIEQLIKDYEKLQSDFAQLTGESSEIKQAMQKAQNHIDNLKFDDAIIAMDYAQALENQDIARTEDNFINMIINKAKKHALKAEIVMQKYNYQQARDNYIDAYQTITDNLSNNRCNDDIRQIQIDYLKHITDNSIKAGLYNDNKTNYYADLAVSFAKEYLGNNHADTLTSINNLALLYQAQGRYNEVEPLLIEILEKSADILGLDHPNTLISMNNLAELYQIQGRYDDAEPLIMESLEKLTEILGRDHSETLQSINNLAELYQAQGRYDNAELLYLESLENRTAILGREHPNTLISINNLASLYYEQRQYDKAEPLYLEALTGLKKIFSNGHPHIEMVENNLENLKEYMNKGINDL